MKRILTLCIFTILIGLKGWGQAVTTNSSSGLAASYPDLASAIIALNGATITAPVTITLNTGNPQTAPSAGYIIIATGTLANTITITGAGTGSTVTASAAQASGVKTDAIFKIVGGDYITLQGFDMKENAANTITTVGTNNMTELGIGIFLTSATNGAQNNTIQNNTIKLSSAYQNAIGILSSSASSQTNVALSASATSGTNSNNKFYGNTISNVAYGMYFISPAVTSTTFETGIDIGGASSSTANTITFGNAIVSDIALTSFSPVIEAGIYFRNNIGNSTRFNNITSNSLSYAQTSGIAAVVYANGTAPTGVTYTTTISDNIINLTNTGITPITGIDFGSGLSTGTITGNTNSITLNQTSAAANSSAITGVKANYANATATCGSNTVVLNQTETAGALSGATTGITVASAGTTLTANSNNITINQTGSGTGTITGATILLNMSGAATTINALTNTILINQTTSVAGGISNAITGISATAAASGALNIATTNVITIKQGATGSGTYGAGIIYYIDLGSAAHGTANVVSNTFNTSGSTIRSTGTLSVINIGTGTLVTLCNIKSNTANIDRVATAGNVNFFNQSSTSPATPADTLSGNNITFTSLAGSGSVVLLQELGGPASPATLNKSICNNVINVSGTITGTVTGINFGYSTGVNIKGNNIAVSTASPTILGIGTGTGVSSASSNTISGNSFSLQSSATSATLLQGINASVGGNFQILNNTFSALGYTGVLTTGGITSAITLSIGSANNINSNIITNISSGAAGSSANPLIDGILVSGGTSVNIYKNKIYGLTTAATGSTTIVNGIRLSGGITNNVYNNLIGNLTATAASSTDAIRGISITATMASSAQNIYYNTIYINASSTGANFGSTGIFHTTSTTSTTSALNLRNNIFVNTSTANGTGFTVAYRRSSGAANSLANYVSTSNNNLFYAGTPSATNLIYYDGSSSAQTIAVYKAGVFTAGTISPRDQASVSENPPFLSTSGASANFLHISTTIPTQVESGGTPVSGITDDYDGDTRNTTTPDIGADEFNGIIADVTPPVITYTAISSNCAGTNATLTATITDASGVPASGTGLPVLYYKINSGAYTAVQGVSIGSNQYTFSFGSGTVGGDIVSYYIVAQDNAPTPNVAISPSSGANGLTPNPPSASTPPTTPNIYTASFTLNGTYTIGTGGNFTTLTAAVAAYNSACNITGPVMFSLLNNISAGETFPITINASSYSSSAKTLTIKPSVTGLSISGSSATGLIVLNGADYIIIDGSVSNTVNTICPVSSASRDLTITNTNAGTGSAVIWMQTTSGSDAATNNTIKNCIIAGSGPTATLAGIGSGSSSIIASSAGTFNNNNSIINNNISKVQYGIFSQGASASNKNTGTVINQNTINTAAPNNVSVGGIYVGYENNITISGNSISNISGANTYAWAISCGLSGFSIGTTAGKDVTNATITKNTIGTIRPADTYGVAGIAMASVTSGTNLIGNNIVSDAFTDATTGDIGAGIYIGGGTGSTWNVFYNAITMASTLSGGVYSNFAMAINGNNPVVNVKNNIFTNTGSNGSSLNPAIGLAYSSFTNLSSNYNDFYASGTGAAVVQTGTLSNSGFTSYTTVTGSGSWNAASGKDANSLNVSPIFTSASNLRLTTANATLNNAGTLVSVTDDIDCAVRDASTPDIGVNEFVAPNPPVINSVALGTSPNCNAIPHTVTANITSGTNPITGVILTYYYNAVAQTPVTMTGGTATGTSTWTGSIPAASPANAAVTWSVTTTDGTVTVGPVSGTSYQDAPLTGVTVTAASPASAICSGGSFNLTATPGGLSIFSEGFEGSFPPSGWTFINAGTGNAWASSTTSHTGSGAMYYAYNSASAANAWGITPGRNLIAGQTYTISFWYEVASGSFPEKLKVTVGNSTTVAAQTTTIWNNNGGSSLTNTTYAQGTATYTPAVSGTYYFGFNCYSDADEFNLYVDDISISANFTYAWSSSPAGFTSTNQNPVGVTETVSTTYNVTATYNGCSITSSPGATVAIASPLSGVYSVGAGNIAGQAGHYPTLTAAVSAYNSICLGGPVTFALTDAAYNSNETFPITINANSNANITNTLTIKPNTSVTATISGNNASALLQLNGADYIIVDGSNTSGGTTQNLSFSNTNSGTSNVIWINSVASPADGATHDTIRNCNIAGLDYVDNVAGIASTGSVNLTNAEVPNSFNAVINNVFTRSQEGVAILGCTSSYDNGWYISGNTMGSSVTANQLSFDGVSISYSQNFNIISNTIAGVVVSSADLVAGIYVFSNILNGNIYGNKISNIKNTSSSGYGSAGIYLGASSTSSNLSVYNNFISDVASYGYNGYTSNDNGNGIDIDAGGGYNIYFNTVDLATNQTSSSGISAALFISLSITTANSLNIRDNIFANDETLYTRYSVLSSAANTVFASMNYNDYWNKGTNLAYSSGNISTLTVLKSGTGFGTANNVNSQNIQPVFVSTTDLHLNPASNTTLDNLGTPISPITTDIDADTRNSITPDIGADEFSSCSATICTWIGAISTDWNIPGNWCNGTLPTATKSVTIPSGVTNYPLISNANAVAASVTINSGASLTMSGTYNLTISTGATFTNNGTFTAIASTGAVIFAGTGTVAGTVNFNNVTINGAVDFGASPISTVTGSLTLNSGSSLSGPSTHQITYGSASSLIYNLGSSVTVGNEWARSAAPDVPGLGVPFNVTIQSSSTVAISNTNTGSWTTNRSIAGALTIASGSTLSSSSSYDLYVAGNWANSGTYNPNGRTVTLDGTVSQAVSGTNSFYNLTLGNTADFGTSVNTIQNTFSNSSGTMNGNASTFIFTGSAGSMIGSNAKNFYNLQINSGAAITHLTGGGNIHLANSFVNNGSLTEKASYNFYFDKSGGSETMSGTGNTKFGNIAVGSSSLGFSTSVSTGTSKFTISGDSLYFRTNGSSLTSTGTVIINKDTARTFFIKNSTGVTTSGTATFYDLNIDSANGISAVASPVDFGSGITNISDSLIINPGGSAITNAPIYANGASLAYNTIIAAYLTGAEWNSNATVPGTGCPKNVVIKNINSVLLAGDRGLGGNLTIAATDTLDLNNHTLSLNGALSSTGFLSGSPASGLIIGGAAGTTHFRAGGINNVLQTFTINNTGSATMGDSIYITAGSAFGTLISNGTLNTNNYLTLRSDINGTAMVGASTGTINGNVTVERYIATGTGSAPNHGKSWQLLATPTQGQTINASWQEGATASDVIATQTAATNPKPGYGTMITSDIPGSAFPSATGFDFVTPKGPTMKVYNSAGNNYIGVTSTALPVYNQKGYFLFVRGDRSVYTSAGTTTPTILRTKGTLYNGTTLPPQTSVTAGKFESVGNPYAAPLDIRNITLGGGTQQFFYLWDPRLGGAYNYGAFQTLSFDGTNYTVTPGGGSYGAAGSVHNYIQSGQAFLVAASASNGTVSFTEASKAGSSFSGTIFARQGDINGRNASLASLSTLRTTLHTVNADSSTGEVADGVLNQFDDSYSNDVDELDARKSANTGENLSILTTDKLLSIERRHTIVENDTIFLNLTGERVQAYRLSIDAQNLNTVAAGYVEDVYTNTRTPLNLRGNTVVNFTIENVAGSYAPDRFRIVFSPLRVLPVTFASIKAYKRDKNIDVEWHVSNENNIKQYEVEKSINGTDFTMLNITKPTNNTGGSAVYVAEDIKPVEGYNYYRIKSIDINGAISYSAIVKVMTGTNKEDININPNPITDGEIHLQFMNESAGKYGIRLLNNLGQVIVSKEITRQDGTSIELINWDFKLAHGLYKLEVTKPDGSVKNINVLY